MDTSQVDSLRSEFISIRDEGIAFFADVRKALGVTFEYPSQDWDHLKPEQRKTAEQVRTKLTDLGHRLLDAARKSPLLEQVDEVEIRRALRSMSASLLLNDYEYHELHVIAEEDRVYGIAPAQHSETPASATDSSKNFKQQAAQILLKMDFLAPSPENLTRAMVSSQVPGVHKYRPDTAFIMMQIDKSNPALEDVKNCIKEAFKEFGIEARRSDEIEHADVITQRILDEIATSEFLMADLTGERPSVYYELGYAHSLGKRPILYRAEGTRLHFDLLVHNVPEYRNITELRLLLRHRLSALTNKTPLTT
jgi:hypothetical protein